MARSVLLGRLIEANSPEVRFRKEWQALRANEARIPKTETEQHPVDLFLQGKGARAGGLTAFNARNLAFG